jgi:hypothetical protein
MPTLQNYARVSQQQSSFALLRRIEHGAVLVALIQGVVGPFHEDFRPLNERGGKETGKGADEDFLEEGGVHPFFESNDSASRGSLYELSNLHVRERD